ncbi:MAG: tRNA (adenosine(37)-N6)-dimethylallyltransferase MiaA [Clostridia bacterium]|nr:tRNA (adenosine(37)-N6)-dimethylallyltransferase MiaA [Clostridia bacterium]MBQ7046770.1 tRNA (adenosine(37)-N6)-dimethylallyltransferase MiaA [Oscillospiraceae bacterium]
MAGYNKIKIISVIGPTASGKTRLAVDICKSIGGEVVSCDSMQIYKYMNIATAKPDAEEMQGVPHHMMDFLEPNEKFSVAAYCDMAKKCIEDINCRDKIPVITGGTGLYYSSLIDNVTFLDEDEDTSIRDNLTNRLENEGASILLEELRSIDPETADKLHPNNAGRIVRALELYYKSGITMSEQKRLSRLAGETYNCTAIGLDARDRQFLYDRINLRVDKMVELGLLEEAEKFLSSESGKTSSQAIGYKELRPYFDGKISLDEALNNLKMETRRYAKRQLTWFRRDKRINWLYIDEMSYDELLSQTLTIIKKG